MSKVAVTYSPVAGGGSVISLKESFQEVGSEVVDADFRQMMADIPEEIFSKLYATPQGRQQLFAHAKAKAVELLNGVDCLALSGNTAMIDPVLFNKEGQKGENYDFSRTIAELALVHVAIEKGMPLLGICGGHQVIAVYGGGEISDLSADNLNKQRYMNYDTVRINKDAMLAQILGGKKLNQDVTAMHYEEEFFGAHYQVVSMLGKGFRQTAVASDNQSIEAAENEFGVPVLTTQFHPEVGAKGLPYAKVIYQGTEHEIESSLKIFDYINKAGDAYHQKKLVIDELKSFKSQNKPSDFKALQKSKDDSVPDRKTVTFNWKVAFAIAIALTFILGTILSAVLFVVFPPAGIAATVGLVGSAAIGATIGALAIVTGLGLLSGFKALFDVVKDDLSSFIRIKISDYFTNEKVAELGEKEAAAEQKVSPHSTLQSPVKSPGEVLRDTPANLWKKPADKECNSTALDKLGLFNNGREIRDMPESIQFLSQKFSSR